MRYRYLIVWWKEADDFPVCERYATEEDARTFAHDRQSEGFNIRIYDLTVDTNANEG